MYVLTSYLGYNDCSHITSAREEAIWKLGHLEIRAVWKLGRFGNGGDLEMRAVWK